MLTDNSKTPIDPHFKVGYIVEGPPPIDDPNLHVQALLQTQIKILTDEVKRMGQALNEATTKNRDYELQIAKLRGAIKYYGEHTRTCVEQAEYRTDKGLNPFCSCGLYKLLNGNN